MESEALQKVEAEELLRVRQEEQAKERVEKEPIKTKIIDLTVDSPSATPNEENGTPVNSENQGSLFGPSSSLNEPPSTASNVQVCAPSITPKSIKREPLKRKEESERLLADANDFMRRFKELEQERARQEEEAKKRVEKERVIIDLTVDSPLATEENVANTRGRRRGRGPGTNAEAGVRKEEAERHNRKRIEREEECKLPIANEASGARATCGRRIVKAASTKDANKENVASTCGRVCERRPPIASTEKEDAILMSQRMTHNTWLNRSNRKPRLAVGTCGCMDCEAKTSYVCSICTHPTDTTQKQYWFCEATKGSECFIKHVHAKHSNVNEGGED